MMDRRRTVKAEIRVPTYSGMTWGNVKEVADEAGIPLRAELSLIIDRVQNPTPLDSGNPPVLKFTWDIEAREYPGD